ncbi:leucyl/phenylalanyl-tRNA--protein transferase [Roseateles amylovorans]|uniref:Leucyl/phenylalanyl-tRNA--protein transferase n=1 Tax=Roseateles amylovorans TaxID=2978473 RepID=A0ABY6B5V9_9BURK|nr:leucyl/phenylalanyl-tRNA--protein transferase [Roseateles amylovorans]UXH80141.1 leucyl/phenylalanyl-tRNA--protein transferase [Roseateles amylovorans]
MKRMIPWLDDESLDFPPTHRALGARTDAPGLLAAGGDLTPARLRAAYARGIFPWYSEGQPILWWTTDPRMVLRTEDFKLSRSLRKTVAKFRRTPGCEIRVNSATETVLKACASTSRDGQNGTWILPEMQQAYLRLAREGTVHSVETWMDGQLVGGLYGVNLGRMFFGESMFMRRTDASKIALAALVCLCRAHRIPWIDCQQQTTHLASLGAAPVTRQAFEAHLASHVGQPSPVDWTYHPALWAHLDTHGDADLATAEPPHDAPPPP